MQIAEQQEAEGDHTDLSGRRPSAAEEKKEKGN